MAQLQRYALQLYHCYLIYNRQQIYIIAVWETEIMKYCPDSIHYNIFHAGYFKHASDYTIHCNNYQVYCSLFFVPSLNNKICTAMRHCSPKFLNYELPKYFNFFQQHCRNPLDIHITEAWKCKYIDSYYNIAAICIFKNCNVFGLRRYAPSAYKDIAVQKIQTAAIYCSLFFFTITE